jgi:hypothetical protein
MTGEAALAPRAVVASIPGVACPRNVRRFKSDREGAKSAKGREGRQERRKAAVHAGS